MSKLRDKLKTLEKDKIKQKWESLDTQKGLSTREKLEKLVNLSLKRDSLQQTREKQPERKITPSPDQPQTRVSVGPDRPVEDRNVPYTCREFHYPFSTPFGHLQLSDWQTISARQLAILFGDEECETLDPMKLLFFDTETTGLAGGTGTIPFMLGFGYFTVDGFKVRIYILNDLARENVFLEEVDRFLAEYDFSATVTYNGKSFDFPLLETRYILQRKRFPLLRLPHLDFLFPARTLWKHTCESRKLGYLGDVLLGLSRDEDIDAAQIPTIYFNYLRTRSFFLMEKVVEHNALDLAGLASLILLATTYLRDISFTRDEGEILGTAKLYEKYGDFDEAQRLYNIATRNATRPEIVNKAVKSLAVFQKKKKLYDEALEGWRFLAESGSGDREAERELAMHFEHREKNYIKALEYAQQAMDSMQLTDSQRRDFEKRLARLKRKIDALDKEE